jgi:hypothetical protein
MELIEIIEIDCAASGIDGAQEGNVAGHGKVTFESWIYNTTLLPADCNPPYLRGTVEQ